MNVPDYFEPSEDDLKAMTRTTSRSSDSDVRQYSNETEEVAARRIFRQALPHAAEGIVEIARRSTHERTRLDACKYIVERNLGRVGDDPAHSNDLMSLVEEMTSALERNQLK